jgi:hypothetical protein
VGTAVLWARRGVSVTAWTVLPAAVALPIGIVYLVIEPRPATWRRTLRATLSGRHGRCCDDG